MIDQLIKPVSDILDKFISDKDLKVKLNHELQREIISLNKLQIELNKQDSKGHWFQSSWRPATAWVCVAGFAISIRDSCSPGRHLNHAASVNGNAWPWWPKIL